MSRNLSTHQSHYKSFLQGGGGVRGKANPLPTHTTPSPPPSNPFQRNHMVLNKTQMPHTFTMEATHTGGGGYPHWRLPTLEATHTGGYSHWRLSTQEATYTGVIHIGGYSETDFREVQDH